MMHGPGYRDTGGVSVPYHPADRFGELIGHQLCHLVVGRGGVDGSGEGSRESGDQTRQILGRPVLDGHERSLSSVRASREIS
jgi:hypothetical protein